jgi:hypothetical protein
MKHIVLSMVLVLAVNCTGYSQDTGKSGSAASAKVSVYFFHGTHRCTGCINAEKATVAVLNELYRAQQDKGIITFQSINIEEPQNKTLAEKYEVAWNMLLIVPASGGKSKVDLTEQAFAYGTNPEGLKPYLKKAIDPLLK